MPLSDVSSRVDQLSSECLELTIAVAELARVAKHPVECYVDHKLVPPELRVRALDKAKRSRGDLVNQIAALSNELCETPAADTKVTARIHLLLKQLKAIRRQILNLGEEFTAFDDEASDFFDLRVPLVELGRFETIHCELKDVLPGTGTLPERAEAFRQRLLVPAERLERVLKLAIERAREITKLHVPLDHLESYRLVLRSDLASAAFCSSETLACSLMEVNSACPHEIGDIIDLAAHELYPGHHTHGLVQRTVLLSNAEVLERQLYPLFSPLAVLSEGIAEAAIQIAFPPADRLRFEAEELFPAARIENAYVMLNSRAKGLMKALAGSRIQLAREYLDGRITREEVIDWLCRFALSDRARAEHLVRFIDTYRSYIATYSLGETLILNWIDRRAGSDRLARWNAFKYVLASTDTASAFLPPN